MARRPFDPAEHGWKRTEYRRGDVLDRSSVDALVDGADVVVHLAFIIFGGRDETHDDQSRGLAQRVRGGGRGGRASGSSTRHRSRPTDFTRTTRTCSRRTCSRAGRRDFYYSAQKAELESLLAEVDSGSATEAYVFRPCIVAGRTRRR